MQKTKKKNKQLFQMVALLGVLIVLVVAFVVGKYLNAKAEEEAAEALLYAVYVPYLDDATTVVLNTGTSEETYLYDAESESWVWSEDAAFPLNDNYLTSMLNTWSVLSTSTELEITDSLSAYGLDPAACSATISNDAGESLTILIGIATGDYYYCMIEGGESIYLISSSMYNYLHYELYDMASKETFPATTSDTLVSIDIATADGADYLLEQELTEVTTIVEAEDEDEEDEEVTETVSTWYHLGEDITEADYLSEVTSEVIGLGFDSMVNYSASAEELAEVGLDAPIVVTVTYTVTETDEDENTTTSTETFTLELGSLTEDEGSCYATINGGNVIYLMDVDDVEYILAVAEGGVDVLFAPEEEAAEE